MRRIIKQKITVEVPILEKFSMIYMEVQTLAPDAGLREISKCIWHLEDENRPTVALCGAALHDISRSVSPALAMLGKPCPGCIKIVKAWLSAKLPQTRDQRMKALIQGDLIFRQSVSRTVPPELFVSNLKPSAT